MLTKVSFCKSWATDVFDRVAPMRKRTPVGMCIMQAGITNTADHVSPASAHGSSRAEHELVDCGHAVREQGFRTQKPHDGPKKRKAVPYGKCSYAECPVRKKKKTALNPTTQLRCMSCKDGKGAWYHVPCFFACHRCTFAG